VAAAATEAVNSGLGGIGADTTAAAGKLGKHVVASPDGFATAGDFLAVPADVAVETDDSACAGAAELDDVAVADVGNGAPTGQVPPKLHLAARSKFAPLRSRRVHLLPSHVPCWWEMSRQLHPR